MSRGKERGCGTMPCPDLTGAGRGQPDNWDSTVLVRSDMIIEAQERLIV